MEKILFPAEEFEKVKQDQVIYEAALGILRAKMQVIMSEYDCFHGDNPIGHIKSRLKTTESIAQKLYKREFPLTAQSARENLADIVGVRVICAFSKDIKRIAKKIREQKDLQFIDEDDYITHPKESGYRSYHMTVAVPVYINGICEMIHAEIQIRTEGMDFWATLEHKAKYKYQGKIPEYLSEELKACAEKTKEIDDTMHQIHEALLYMYNEKGEQSIG